MGFIVLIAVGAILGWIASILFRGDDGRSIALNIALGMLGAFVAGGLASQDSLLIGLSATALLAATVGALVLLAAFNVARGSLAR
jgi:uncharacterized membrane protein YeaQ/YmgE (transglycosylase-associated protein family)